MTLTTQSPNNFTQIAESLLARPLVSQDGVNEVELKEAEQRLARKLPTSLVSFYLSVGQLPQFMSAFQLFALPEQLYVKDDLLIFLEENQGACYWGVDEQQNVFQCEEDNSRYELGLTLTEFLTLMLYYQVAQGAEYTYCSNLLDQELAPLYEEDGWQLVVKQDDLVIYQLNTYLIWFFKDEEGEVLDDMVYFVSLQEIPQSIITKYVLEEL